MDIKVYNTSDLVEFYKMILHNINQIIPDDLFFFNEL